MNLNLDSVEQVIDKIKSFQFNHQSIYEKPKKEVREIYFSSDNAISSEDEITTVKVRKLKQQNSSNPEESSIMIPILVHGITVDGIIDTALDVTIISDKVYNSLPVKPSMPCILLEEICL